MAVKKIGYLGPVGTFSEDAGIIYLKKINKTAKLIPYSTIHDVLYAVSHNKIDEGIVPIENSIEGTIGIVPDMLAGEVNLKIRNEIAVPIHNILMAKKKIKLKSIKEIVSHPQPIEQSRTWLRKNVPQAKISLAYSTSQAAYQVALSQKEDIAAIASQNSARLYKLKIIAKNVTEYRDNVTRFVVLSKTDNKPTGKDKTSIVFSIVSDKPGGLYAILGEFSLRNINLTKIESRPSKKALGDYFFFADMDGHRSDSKVKDALADIQGKVSFLKILGSYPKGV